MLHRSLLSAFALCCVILLSPVVAHAGGPGPTTPEERKQALDYIHDLKTDPLGPNAKQERQWITQWMLAAPEVEISICPALLNLPKGDEKDSLSLLVAFLASQAELQLENPDSKRDVDAQYLAGVQGALQVYDILLKSNPKDRRAYLDDLVQQRKDGTLAQYVKELAASSCQ